MLQSEATGIQPFGFRRFCENCGGVTPQIVNLKADIHESICGLCGRVFESIVLGVDRSTGKLVGIDRGFDPLYVLAAVKGTGFLADILKQIIDGAGGSNGDKTEA